jgi:hypothetical protein
MKKFVPFLTYVVAAAFAVFMIALVLYPYGKGAVKENALVKANDEAGRIVIQETDFDKIIAYIEEDDERRHFLGVTLLRLAENETMYAFHFEARYPRYKAYRDMVSEFARTDYSEWVASIIAGTTETEFEANVFDYLSNLKDQRYLNAAINRFVGILNDSGSNGFTAQTNKEAFIIGALSLYIIQFPGNNSILRSVLGEKADQFAALSENNLTEIRGVPLNQAYIYLYLKYFGLEELINEKMEIFLGGGDVTWDRKTWPMEAVDSLISYFSSIGKGMSQNFYSLIQSGFDKNDSVRIYIALQVLKNIGVDDPNPVLTNLLNRVARRESGLAIITTSYGGQTRREIIFSDEAAEVRRAVNGKEDMPFEQMLNNALTISSQTGNFIIPRVSAIEVIEKEISERGGQYTKGYIADQIELWNKKNDRLKNFRIIAIIIVLATCSTILFTTKGKYKRTEKIIYLIVPYGGGISLVLLLTFAVNTAIAMAEKM